MPRAAAGRRGRQRARVHQWPLRPGLPRSRRHPCAAGRGGQAPGAGRVSDDLGGWGGAEFVLAADRLDTPDVIEAADPGDMLRQVAPAAAPGPPPPPPAPPPPPPPPPPDGHPPPLAAARAGRSPPARGSPPAPARARDPR